MPNFNSYKTEGGLRTKGINKKTPPSEALVTIITVVFNGSQHIEQTIQSVLCQTYDNIEYIIIDGGSTDGTLDIIRKYDHKISYWISEPDKGIYDAMNKGITLVNGEWVIFMNAGDTFYRPDTVASIFKDDQNSVDLICGHNEIIYNDDFSVVRKALDVNHLWKGMIFCHQSLFTRTSLMKQHPFDPTYQLSADYEFVYYALTKKYRLSKYEIPISTTVHGGVSDKNVISHMLEHWAIARKYSNTLQTNAYYVLAIFFAFFKGILKKILPMGLKKKILKLKYR